MDSYVSKEQVKQAKEIDLLTYLRMFEPNILKSLYTNYCNGILTLEEYQDYKVRYIESVQNIESKIESIHTEIKSLKDGLDQRIEVEIKN